jgi:hypothetical protein
MEKPARSVLTRFCDLAGHRTSRLRLDVLSASASPLRTPPHDRGRHGWLLLFTTTCRFIPALKEKKCVG